VFVLTTESKAAAAVRIGAGLALEKRGELAGLLRPCFARTQVWLQAGKYVAALMSELPERNGWSIARHAGDRTPDKTQRLLDHASWDTMAAMSIVRRFAAAGLDGAARRNRRTGGMTVGRWMRPGRKSRAVPQPASSASTWGARAASRTASTRCTCRMCGRRPGALIGARQWIPREHITDPVRSLATGLPADLQFRTKGQLAIDICADAYADGISFDFICGDETSDAVKLSSCCGKFLRGVGEGDGLVVVLAGGQAAVEAAEEPSEEVALGGGVPVAGLAAAVVVGAGAG
jgi:hypothetical protein